MMMMVSSMLASAIASILLHTNLATAAATTTAVEKLGRLFTDIAESVRKASQDTELVFAQVYGFDKQLEVSLMHEKTMLNSTKSSLSRLRKQSMIEKSQSTLELSRLEAALRGSAATDAHFQASESHADATFDGFQNTIAQTLASLRHAKAAKADSNVVISKDLVAKVRHSLRSASYRTGKGKLQKEFRDVYAAFETNRSPESLTRKLLGRTMKLLQELATSSTQRRTKLLVQLEGRRQRLTARTTDASTKADAARRKLSEEVQHTSELSFSVGFSSAAGHIDDNFLTKVRDQMTRKTDLVLQLRAARSGQLTTLKELSDLVSRNEEKQIGASSTSLSFLQRSPPSSTRRPAPTLDFSALQTEIEAAIRQKNDTHAILMRMKAALNPSPPTEDSVNNVVAAIGTAMRSVDTVQTSAEDATRACTAQRFAVDDDQRRLRSTLSLAAASENHTMAAIRATRHDLDGIASKAQALNHSATGLAEVSSQLRKVLNKQRRDRSTIHAALRKAKELAGQSLDPVTAPPAMALLGRLVEQYHAEDSGERAYEAQQLALEREDAAFTRDYNQLLTERKLHYQSSLSALELYASEIVGDANTKQAALANGAQLQDAGQDLCDSIMTFYKKHTARREHLSGVLREVLPKIPDVLSKGDPSSSGSRSLENNDFASAL
jgi:hypothetical protein